jgi:hypothetical protein
MCRAQMAQVEPWAPDLRSRFRRQLPTVTRLYRLSKFDIGVIQLYTVGSFLQFGLVAAHNSHVIILKL